MTPPDTAAPTAPATLQISAAKSLLLAAGLIGLLKKHGIITADGEAFDVTRPPAEWTSFLKDVEDLLLEMGVAVPTNVQKAINGAAFYLPLIQALVAQTKS